MKIVKVLDGAVKLEDGGIRNLRHVSLFEGVNMSENEDDIEEYLLGSDFKLQPVVGPDTHFYTYSDSGHNANKSVPTTSGMILRRSQRKKKLPGHLKEFVMEC
ncbi:hypothetical protein NDU88_003858 [Pleurodeles waltl]|uniref:Uncharacterized protein n=1 Tax=Pleurodeles waltl TaxID=8319 RepID=A0AAV7TRU0_PLEWA|nr:hypothetical protein NDU88_003858 [Pleurodeles waltl]